MLLKGKSFLTLSLAIIMILTIFKSTFLVHAVDLSETTDITQLLSPEELPDIIMEDSALQFGHVKRIDDSKLDQIMFLNQDNTVSVYQFTENVKYIDENGKVQDKSNVLKHQLDGSYENVYNDVKMSFSSQIQDGVTISFNGAELTMTPFNDDSQVSKLSQHSQIKYISSEDNNTTNSVAYDNVFDKDSRIIYTPLFSGIKEDILLTQKPISNIISFKVELTNAYLDNKKSYIEIKDFDSNQIGIINPITVISSNNLFSDGIYQVSKLESTNNGYIYKISLELDSKFLESPDVVYPIVVDPTIVAVSGTNKNIVDATLYQNQSSMATGYIQYNNVGYLTNDSFGYARSIIKFPGLMNDTAFCMVPNERLNSVYLYMYCVAHTTNTTVFAYQYTGSSNWTESTVKSGLSAAYNNDLSTAGSKLITSGSSTSPSLFSIDITALIKNWKTDKSKSDYGLLVKNVNETNTAYGIRFASTDATANRPYIVYNYTQSTSFSIKNVYSNRFSNGVGSNAATYINGANTFINKVFSDTFGVKFTNSGTTNRKSLIDSCPNGRDTACSSVCGSNCISQHHRNVIRYSNDISNIPSRPTNTVYIAWDYASKLSLCESSTSTHVPKGTAMALVTKMPNTESRGIIVPNKYWDGRNVICVFEPTLNFSMYYPQECMKLIAAHEMAHVMGINDTYDGKGADENHNVDSDTWTCIMRSFNKTEAGATFVSDIESGRKKPFCDYCKNLIDSTIKTRYFPAS